MGSELVAAERAAVRPFAPAIVNDVLRTPGNPLEIQARARMEARFGHDFGHVRVHHDETAARSAAAINARAYAVGHHVVFGRDHQPASSHGQALLAHELAHVVQQREHRITDGERLQIGPVGDAYEREAEGRAVGNRAPAPLLRRPPAVQRVADFEVGGREIRPGDTSNLFFERASSAILPDQATKIPAIVSLLGAATPLFLDGYTSEDEPAVLATSRATAVGTALSTSVPTHHTGTRTVRNQSALGLGRIDYRMLRKVEVLTTVGGAPPPPSAPATITRPCGTAFTSAKPRALTFLSNAITALSGPLSASTSGLLSSLFAGPPGVAAAGTIKANLVKLKNHVDIEMGPGGTVVCHTLKDAGCVNPAYNVGTGPTAVMTLCPQFLDNPGDVDKNAFTLVHEGAHGTTGLATVDLAYGHTRMIQALTTAQALTNTDSYMLLVRNINAALGITSAQTIGVAGDVQVGMTAAETRAATTALAHLEKWLTQGYQDVASVYQTVSQSVAAGAWTGSTVGFDRETLHRIAPHFGLTDPGTAPPFPLPTAGDKIKLAAIHDRFLAMRRVMWGRGITMTKVAAPPDAWAAGPGSSVNLTAAFFALGSDLARVKFLAGLIVAAHPDISAPLRPHYVDAADQIRLHRGLGP